MGRAVCISSSLSLLWLHSPKDIGGKGSPSGKHYGKTEAIRVKIGQVNRDHRGKSKLD